MTKEEAKNVYVMASAICTEEKEIKKLCIEKGVPEPWIAEFIEEEENGELLTE